MRLGETADEPLRHPAPQHAALQLTAAEAQTLERLKATPFGTWFEVVGDQPDERVPHEAELVLDY